MNLQRHSTLLYAIALDYHGHFLDGVFQILICLLLFPMLCYYYLLLPIYYLENIFPIANPYFLFPFSYFLFTITIYY